MAGGLGVCSVDGLWAPGDGIRGREDVEGLKDVLRGLGGTFLGNGGVALFGGSGGTGGAFWFLLNEKFMDFIDLSDNEDRDRLRVATCFW